MSKELPFLIYCIEIYKNAKNLSGKEVFSLFKDKKVNEYIIDYFDSLHTTGKDYIISDIDTFISTR